MTDSLLLESACAAVLICVIAPLFLVKRPVSQPCCSVCLYPIAHGRPERCPECGADYRETGVFTPESGRAPRLVRWIALLAVATAIAQLLAIVTWNAAKSLEKPLSSIRTELTLSAPASGQFRSMLLSVEGVRPAGFELGDEEYKHAQFQIVRNDGTTTTRFTVRLHDRVYERLQAPLVNGFGSSGMFQYRIAPRFDHEGDPAFVPIVPLEAIDREGLRRWAASNGFDPANAAFAADLDEAARLMSKSFTPLVCAGAFTDRYARSFNFTTSVQPMISRAAVLWGAAVFIAAEASGAIVVLRRRRDELSRMRAAAVELMAAVPVAPPEAAAADG